MTDQLNTGYLMLGALPDTVKILKERFSKVQVEDCSEILWELRRIKTPAEIEVIRQAGKIGAEAMVEVMKAGRPGQYEYELSSLYEHGVRIENTVVVTEKGCEILNPGIPREIEEIEALMQNKAVGSEQGNLGI